MLFLARKLISARSWYENRPKGVRRCEARAGIGTENVIVPAPLSVILGVVSLMEAQTQLGRRDC